MLAVFRAVCCKHYNDARRACMYELIVSLRRKAWFASAHKVAGCDER